MRPHRAGRRSDGVQETLIVVLNHLADVRDPAAFAGRLRTVAIREAVRIANRAAPCHPVEVAGPAGTRRSEPRRRCRRRAATAPAGVPRDPNAQRPGTGSLKRRLRARLWHRRTDAEPHQTPESRSARPYAEVMPQDLVAPMLVTPGALPSAADDGRYAYETKWDGLRAVAYLYGSELTLRNRNGADITTVYPELAGAGRGGAARRTRCSTARSSRPTRHGQVDFGALQPRMHLRNATRSSNWRRRSPVSYRIFDLMRLDGRDVTPLPYTERREPARATGAGPGAVGGVRVHRRQEPPTWPIRRRATARRASSRSA